jgi:CTP:molybdopterin cytidylyltransferase MocA
VTLPAAPFTALVMAGSRATGDPLARATGVAHKALAPVRGVPMLARVLRTLRHSRRVGRIIVCGLDRTQVEHAPEVDALLQEPPPAAAVREAPIEFARGDATPSASAVAVIESRALQAPLLITTADHPLLTVATVDEFCIAAAASAADLAFGVAPGDAVRAAFPGSRRTVYRFRDGRYCGCNLYALLTVAGLAAPRLWREVEQHRKRPWRIVSMLGPLALARFILGRLALTQVTTVAQARFALQARAVVLSDPAAGFDVDTVEQLRTAEEYLATVGAAAESGAGR